MTKANSGQSEFWNTAPGQLWVDFQPDLDLLFDGVLNLVMRKARPRAGERALDIGCGAGALSFALAEAVTPAGGLTGVDISAALLAAAERQRQAKGLAQLRFLLADAQDHPFERDSVDLVASRFGVMFFADPVAAFRNLASALRPGGRLVVAAWAAAESNPWFSVPQRAVADRFGPQPLALDGGPGPLAFRGVDRVVGVLRDSGLREVQGSVHSVDLNHPGGLDAVSQMCGWIGPVSAAMRANDGTDADRNAMIATVRDGFAAFAGQSGLRIPATINLFEARMN